MIAKGSMNDYINKAVKRYSSLFKLPSHKRILTELAIICLVDGILITTTLRYTSPSNLLLGLTLGITLFAFTLISDYLVYLTSQGKDPIFSLRRCSALSLYSLLVWLSLTVVGVVANLFSPNVWFKFFFIGFCAALALRILVFSAISFGGTGRVAVLAISLPLLYTVPVAYTALRVDALLVDIPLLAFFCLSIAVTVLAIFTFMFYLNSVGHELIGVDSLSVLKAFMATWTENLNTPFESLFERFSQEQNIELSALSFRNSSGQVKAMLVVPAFHPGPFKNLGSSDLPYRIQRALENKLSSNCVVAVPHGLSGHDLDLATQAQNEVVLNKAIKLSDGRDFGSKATPFVRVRRSGAIVSCQVFNDCAFVSLTLAPETMEDLPPELNSLIAKVSKSSGFSQAIAVDAHNSIDGPFEIEKTIKPLQEAVSTCLEEASKQQPASFQIGTAKVIPKEFSLEQGMGPGGIIAFVVKVDAQITTYITIDGNNMVSGLRERIITALSELGVNESEVFTTDTHAVNAVVLDARGYHPVGEAIDQESLIRYVKQATLEAMANLEPAEVASRADTVPNVKVIGERQIQALCLLVDKASRRAKNLAIGILPVLAVIFGALLLLL